MLAIDDDFDFGFGGELQPDELCFIQNVSHQILHGPNSKYELEWKPHENENVRVIPENMLRLYDWNNK